MLPEVRRSLAWFAVGFVVLVIGAFALRQPQLQPAPNASVVREQPSPEPLIIGLSLASRKESRWQKEADIMSAEADRSGARLLVVDADNNADTQEEQTKSLLQQGAKVLIVVPVDADKAAAIVDRAHVSNASVIAYDRLIRNANLDYYLSFDNVKVGEAQAQGVLDAMGGKGDVAYIGGSPTDNNASLVRKGSFGVLQPAIDSGAVTVVLDKQVQDWDADRAYHEMASFLASGGKLDGAVVANDGMAGGVIKALREKGLDGKVSVSGQDAELRACRDLLTGAQTMTVYKPLRSLAQEAVKMALQISANQPAKMNASVNNGKRYVPSQLLDVVAVTKDNLDATVIRDGLYARKEVYENRK